MSFRFAFHCPMSVRRPEQGLTRLEIYAIIAIVIALLTYIVPIPQAPPRQNTVAEQELEAATEALQETEHEDSGE